MPHSITVTTLLFLAAFLAAAIGVYQNLLRRIVEGSGKVRTAEFELPDLLVTLVLAGFFTMLAALALLRPAPEGAPMQPENVLPGAFFFIVLVLVIAGFLRYRGVRLWRLFGFDRISIGRALAVAVGLVLAAFPLILASSALTQSLMDGSGQEQDLVTLFREVARKSDRTAMAQIFLAGVCFAPVAEEFIFRGYFYGVLKRYCGGTISGLLTALLFAGIHMNLASLPSLLVLALCLTIAYESTGCLLVPVGMHSLFNLSQLGYLFYESTRHAT